MVWERIEIGGSAWVGLPWLSPTPLSPPSTLSSLDGADLSLTAAAVTLSGAVDDAGVSAAAAGGALCVS